MQKVKKSTKPENAKHEKVIKLKSTKKHKKSVKNWLPPKMAKMSLKWHFLTVCVFRAAWLGAFSIPGGTTGPGFKAEIRPPLFSSLFHVLQLTFSPFSLLWNWRFCHFWCFIILCILMKVTFLRLLVIRPYCNIGGSMKWCVVVLPSFLFLDMFCWLEWFSCRGDYTG